MAAKAKKSGRLAIYTRQDKAILFIGYVLLALFVVAIVVPVVYIVIASFMDPVTLQNQGITFDFSKWTLTAYERVATDAQIWTGFKNAVLYSVLFTVISVVVTMLAAYPMSLPDFRGKKIFNTLFVITMFFGGGLIPTYLLINNLGLLDSMWGRHPARRVQRLEHDHRPHLLPGRPPRAAGGLRCGRRQRDDLLLQDPGAHLYASGGGAGPVAVRRHVEQLL